MKRRRWLPAVLQRIHELARTGRIEWTEKASDELMALDLALSTLDVRDLLMALGPGDSLDRKRSIFSGDWMYVFLPRVGGVTVYLKLIVRRNCVIISFHEDEPL